TEAALVALASHYERRLDGVADSLADVCFAANAGRSQFEWRLAVVAATPGGMQQRLAGGSAGTGGAGLCRGPGPGPGRAQLAFLFPGEGGAFAGMGRQLFDTQPTFRASLLRCEELLRHYLRRPLTEVLFQQTGLLDQPDCTPPALFALEYALAQLWWSCG